MGDPLSVLSAVGGLEIAAICGLCIGGAARRMMVVVDGFISTAAALVAMRLIFFFEKEGIRPILDLGLRLGEGTGAALGMQIIENSLRLYQEMATFEEVGITPGT